jgi:hypothetical protein
MHSLSLLRKPNKDGFSSAEPQDDKNALPGFLGKAPSSFPPFTEQGIYSTGVSLDAWTTRGKVVWSADRANPRERAVQHGLECYTHLSSGFVKGIIRQVLLIGDGGNDGTRTRF